MNKRSRRHQKMFPSAAVRTRRRQCAHVSDSVYPSTRRLEGDEDVELS